MYDPHSLHAEEFLDHEEVQEALAWAAEHARDAGLIDSILAKAALCKGLSHREASVLLACELPDRVEALYRLANRSKHEFYGNRIVMFAPLYLSNYCVNSCVYCPYHARNKHIVRKKLSQEEVAREVIALQDMGHKRLALEAGEHPAMNPIGYILDCIRTIYGIRHKNGAIRRVNVNIAATTVEEYRMLKDAGIPVNAANNTDNFQPGTSARRKMEAMVFTMTKTPLGRLCVSDHAMHAVSEMKYLDEAFAALRRQTGTAMPMWEKLRNEMPSWDSLQQNRKAAK